MVVEELVALLGFDLKGEGDLRKFQSGLDGATKGLGNFVRTAGLFAAAAGTAVAAGAGALAKSVIEVGSTFENLKVVLTTLEGSSEKAQQSLDWVSDFAAKTPYDLEQVADAFVRLRSYGLDPTTGLLRSIGDASSAMGKDLMQGVEAVADAMTGENERLKEFGITASVAGDQITYAWTQNGVQMKRTVKKDAIEIQQALTGIFDAKFFGVMEERSKTLDGIVSNVGDLWLRFQQMIADAGVFDWVKGQFKGLLDAFQKFANDGTLKRVATAVSASMVQMGEGFKSLFEGVTVEDVTNGILGLVDAAKGLMDFGRNMFTAAKSIGEFVSEILGLGNPLAGLAVLIGGIAALFNPWIAGFALLFLFLDDLAAYLDGRSSLIGEGIKALNDVLASIGVDVDLSALGEMFKAFAKTDAAKIVAIAGGIALLAGRMFGLAGALMVLRIGVLIEFAKALGKLISALSGVDSFGELLSALQSLSAFDWLALGAGFLLLLGPIRQVLGAVRGLIGAFSTLQGAAKVPQLPGGAPDSGTKPNNGGAGNGNWLSGLSSMIVPAISLVAAGLATQFAAQGSLTVEGHNAEVIEHREEVSKFNAFVESVKSGFAGMFAGPKTVSPVFNGNDLVSESHFQAGATRDNNLAASLGPILEKLRAVAGPEATDAAMQTIDSSTTTTNITNTVSAPVSVQVTTNASPSQIGGAVRDGVVNAGINATRRMGVAGSSGGAAP